MGQSPPTIGSETHTRGDLLRGGAGNVRTYAIVPSIGLAERLRREGHVGRVKRDDRLDVERLPCLGPGARPAGSGGADVRHAGDGATRMSSRDISVESRPRRLLGAVWPIDRWCPRSGCAGVGRCRVSIADGSTELRPGWRSRAFSPMHRRWYTGTTFTCGIADVSAPGAPESTTRAQPTLTRRRYSGQTVPEQGLRCSCRRCIAVATGPIGQAPSATTLTVTLASTPCMIRISMR
jgi:hypothetical protein